MLAKKEISDSITAYVNVIETDKSFRFTLNDLNNVHRINNATSPVSVYSFIDTRDFCRPIRTKTNVRNNDGEVVFVSNQVVDIVTFCHEDTELSDILSFQYTRILNSLLVIKRFIKDYHHTGILSLLRYVYEKKVNAKNTSSCPKCARKYLNLLACHENYKFDEKFLARELLCCSSRIASEIVDSINNAHYEIVKSTAGKLFVYVFNAENKKRAPKKDFGNLIFEPLENDQRQLDGYYVTDDKLNIYTLSGNGQIRCDFRHDGNKACKALSSLKGSSQLRVIIGVGATTDGVLGYLDISKNNLPNQLYNYDYKSIKTKHCPASSKVIKIDTSKIGINYGH
jgi:hypothetical protein